MNSKNKINWGKWPDYGPEHVKAVERVIKSGQIFAADEVSNFETAFKMRLLDGYGFSYGCGNATQGLHLALAAGNIGLGDEVIVSNYSWISTASCVLMQNAVPIFIDFDLNNLGLNFTKIHQALTVRTKALIVTHMLGYTASIDEIKVFCKQNNLLLIEDASHAHGGRHNGHPLGTFGDISVFSLHQRKTLSCGEGGMIWTNNADIAEKIRRLRSFGHEELSYNYRMNEFAAALGIEELKLLEERTRSRKELSELFDSKIHTHKNLKLLPRANNDQHSYYATPIIIDKVIPEFLTEDFINKMVAQGIPIRKTWAGLNKHPHFARGTPAPRGKPWALEKYSGESIPNYELQRFDNSDEYLPNRILELYIHPFTPRESIEYVADYFERFFN